MRFQWLLIFAGLLFGPVSGMSKEAQGTPGVGAVIKVTVKEGRQPRIVLEARHAELIKVVDALAREAGVAIHYNQLPDEFLSSNCSGANVKDVLTCILGPGADLADKQVGGSFAGRGLPTAMRPDKQGAQPAGKMTDIWILETSFQRLARDNEADAPGCSANATRKARLSEKQAKAGSGLLKSKEVEALLKEAEAEDHAQKLTAISQLAAQGRPGDEQVVKVLQQSLADQSPEVRAQGVYGLSRQGGAVAGQVLREAIHDPDISVRLMAVDSAGNDADGIAVLSESMADTDPTIRTYAAEKMESFTNPPQQHP